MKSIQFKKTGFYTGNHGEVTKILGGAVNYIGQHGKNDAIKTYERDSQTFPLQFDDWIIDLNGKILVLNEDQYQEFLSS